MQYKVITLLTLGLVFSTILSAFNEYEDSAFILNASGQQELKTLKDIHNYNEIFDNYHLGGTSPDVEMQKEKSL